MIRMSNNHNVPQLAFGMYKVSPEETEKVVLQAIRAGYRHFDTASFYQNEEGLGKALKKSGLPREEFFVCSKVWNDAQKLGRKGVRESFEKTLQNLQCNYLDLYLVHWPVPGYHTETYKEMELFVKEGKLKNIGISNYTPLEFEELQSSGIKIMPILNQIEVSPFMYRPDIIAYFQTRNVHISAFKALNRAAPFQKKVLQDMAKKYSVTPAQILLRWGIQKNLIIVAKTSTPARMYENRNIFHFHINETDITILDSLTTPNDILQRKIRENQTKSSI